MSSQVRAGREEGTDTPRKEFEPIPPQNGKSLANPTEEFPVATPAIPVASSVRDTSTLEQSWTNGDPERRQFVRDAAARGMVEVCLIGSTLGRVRTHLCDLSGGGLCLSLPAPVAVGALLAVWPDGFPGEASVTEVRHCRQKSGRWRVGCVFLDRPLVNPAALPEGWTDNRTLGTDFSVVP